MLFNKPIGNLSAITLLNVFLADVSIGRSALLRHSTMSLDICSRRFAKSVVDSAFHHNEGLAR